MKQSKRLSFKEKLDCIAGYLVYPFKVLIEFFRKSPQLLGRTRNQIIAGILTVVMIFTALPVSALSEVVNQPRPGDVNSDNKVDLKDVLDFAKYLEGQEVTFDKIAADVNVDTKVDKFDLLMIKRSLTGWDVKLGEGMCVISFDTQGGTPVEPAVVKAGTKLEKTPSTSKENFTFIGWKKQNGEEFFGEDEIVSSMTLVAQYNEMPSKENLTLTTFTQMNQTPDIFFTVASDQDLSVEQVKEKLKLEVKDGSAAIELTVEKNADGTFKVYAVDGFNEGCSYNIVIDDELYFKDKEKTIKNASFTIDKEEVADLKFKEDMIYIKDTEDMTYNLSNGVVADVLDFELIENDTQAALTGTFSYSEPLEVGEAICIYENVKPTDRDMKDESKYEGDSAAFIEITKIDGNIVSFRGLDDKDAMDILFMPDTLPFKVAVVPTFATGTVDGATYDTQAWSYMGKKEKPKFDVGDFVVFYSCDFADMSDMSVVYYGEVTAVNGETLTYKMTTPEAIKKCMDVFTNNPISGKEMLKEVDTQALVKQVEAQMRSSGFAEDSARYFAIAAMNTDPVKNMPGAEKMRLTKEDGTPLSANEMKAIGGEIQLSEDVKLRVELDDSSVYFNDGIRLAVGISAEFSVDVGEGEMKILLNATFVEEIAIDVNIGAKAHITWYFIIPIINELGMNANVDVKNYSAISIDLRIYTIAGDDLQVSEDWGDFQELKDTFDKIAELEKKIEDAKDTIDKINGYKEDLKKLLDTVTGDDEVTFEKLAETFGEMNITDDLMGLLNITDEAELDAGVKDLMDKYCEILEQECGWVELLREEIFSQGTSFYKIIAVNLSMDFIISGKVNIALGANMEYVVGKRYAFWFEIMSRTAGSSQMDILDERFAFQFYVMGALGMRMGVEFEIAIGFFDTKSNSIGITAEFGPYVMIYGYFIYEYTQMRPANSDAWQYDEKMMGALYIEFGLYIEVTFKAQVGDGAVKYEPTLFEEEYPLLDAGTRRSVYDFGYKVEDDEVLRILDDDGDGKNGYTMKLPDSYRSMSYVDLQEGVLAKAEYPINKFYYNFSNRNFSIDEETGKIMVNVPEGVSYMECDLRLTWKMDKLAYRNEDLAQTVHLVWTNLSTAELKEPFTANVKVGNEIDGYTTVWSKRIIKNKEFDLPTQAEVLKLLNYDTYDLAGFGNLKYSKVDGYTLKDTEALTINRDTDYYFEVTPREYTLTVNGVKNADGTTSAKKFTAKYGEKFDISSLEETGESNDDTHSYSVYYNTTANKDGILLTRNVNDTINRLFAQELIDINTEYVANYVDNSVSVVYKFIGADIEPQTIKIEKGTVPGETYMDELILQGKMVKSISPAMGPVNTATTFTVQCEETNSPKHTITYNTNGGNEIPTGTYFEGSALSAPTAPVKTGYVFEGWYSDESLTTAFNFTTMKDKDIVLFAKWKGKEYTITFDAREGIIDGQNTKTVIYGEKYGDLVNVTRPGHVFEGWYKQALGTEKVTKDSVYDTAGNQTLFAHWKAKTFIEKSEVTIPQVKTTYDKNEHFVTYAHKTLNDFTVQYKRQNTDTWENNAIFAGTYDIRITRPEDTLYQSFDETYLNVMTIDKAVRTIDPKTLIINSVGFNRINASIDVPDNRGDIYLYATVPLTISGPDNETLYDKANNCGIIKDLYIDGMYFVDVAVKNDLNYVDVTTKNMAFVKTKEKPTTSWNDYADTSWYNSESTSFTLDTAAELAGLSKLTNQGNNFAGKIIDIQGGMINLGDHIWTPIGDNSDHPFKGSLYGGMINEMYCEATTAYGGFIGLQAGGEIGKVNISESYVIDCLATISQMMGRGGLVGYASDTCIADCVVDARIIGSENKFNFSGGIVGYAEDVRIMNCRNDGDVQGMSAGGIAAYFLSAKHYSIEGCKNTGMVGGKINVGGIAGCNDSGASHFSILNCINEGLVTGGTNVGGITGMNQAGNVVNCANRGSVNGTECVGGIVGINDRKTSIVENCYNTGYVTGTTYVGAVAGRNTKNQGNINKCYYLQGSASGNGSACNGVGKDGGTVPDDFTNLNIAYFTSFESDLSRDTGYGRKDSLIKVLNKDVKDWTSGALATWVKGEDNYPDLPNAGKVEQLSLKGSRQWKKQPDEAPQISNDMEATECTD